MVMLTPKYLTPELAERAVAIAKRTVFGSGPRDSGRNFPVKREAFHIVILVPSIIDVRAGDSLEWLNQPLLPTLLYEQSWKFDHWTAPYDKIARSKALQHWQGRSNGKVITPHLLFSGDTPFVGSVERDGIVAACSGVQPRYDRLMCSIALDSMIALAEEAYKADDPDAEKDFLD